MPNGRPKKKRKNKKDWTRGDCRSLYGGWRAETAPIAGRREKKRFRALLRGGVREWCRAEEKENEPFGLGTWFAAKVGQKLRDEGTQGS